MKIVSIVSFPFTLLREFSRDEQTKKKLKNFVIFQFGWLMLAIIKTFLGKTSMKLANTDAQCIIALIILIAKMSTSFCFSTMMNRIVGKDNERANLSLATHINLAYGLFVAVIMISVRPFTAVCMLLVDMILQLVMTY